MKLLFLGLTALICSLSAIGQSLQFDKPTHDFGEIKEEDGPATFTFNFANAGEEAVSIVGVRASCGCTTPDWTKVPIAPADSGFVTAKFNPFNRPGPFNKSLRVTTSKGQVFQLRITGVVIPRPKTVAEELPNLMGSIRMQFRALNMGRITTEKPVQRDFVIYNEGLVAVSMTGERTELPSFVTLQAIPEVLAPKARGVLRITYDPAQAPSLGFNEDPIVLHTSDSMVTVKRLKVLATVEEYFPPMSQEELSDAPRLTFDQKQHDFGRLDTAAVSTDFVLTNNGLQSLNVRTVRSNCNCIETSLSTADIAPGESATLTVTFSPEGRRARQYKTVTVFSNDPVAPTQVLSIRADVRQ